ncbi:MAG: ABC transporter substrate-binding protein [Oscillospiraceae bacterium]|nr:ABC transporter substrate-binding protein [Oscillospiraceae bacterium]
MKKILALLLALALAASLAACASREQTSETVLPEQSAGPDWDGETLLLALLTNNGTTAGDRVPTPWQRHTLATSLMWRGLLAADSTLTRTEPDLAESVEISGDGLTYTITLKDGLKWSDGVDLTAADVIWSIQAVQQTPVKNSVYSNAFGRITELTAEGNVITMELSAPYGAMRDVLAQFYILPEHCLADADLTTLDTHDFWKEPVTSGYYRLDELYAGDCFTLVPNEYYEGTAPKIKKVKVSFVEDFLTAAQAGEAHYIYGNTTELYSAMDALEGFTTRNVGVLFYKYFLFNVRGSDGNVNEAMADVNVRRAIISAIDRESLAALYPSAEVLNSGVPASYAACEDFAYSYDPEEAKRLLEESEYDLARPLRICCYNNDRTSLDLIGAVAEDLEAVGFTVETVLSDDAASDLFQVREYDIGFKGKTAFSVEEWYAEYRSTDRQFSQVFGGDTAFDEAVTALNAATTAEERNAALEALQALEREMVYKLPICAVGNAVYLSDALVIPEGVSFCDPRYACDVDFENWTFG